MIEADKMLHLRKYILLALRSDTISHIARSLQSKSSPVRERGYVLRSLYHHYVLQVNSRPTYTACGIRTFSTTVAQSSVDEVSQKLTSFCDDVKHGQTWSVDRLKELIQLCDENNYQLQPSASVLLLKCCGSSLSNVKSNERQNLANWVWRLAKKNGALTLDHYNTLLNVHADNCSSVDPKEFLANMDMQPDDDTYRLLFNTAVKTGNTKHLQNVMPMILEKNISLNDDTFCTLMQTHLTKGNITEALNIITLAQDAKLPVNNLYSELACGYAAQGDIFNLVKILNDEPQSNTSLLKVIKSLSMSGNGRHIPAIVNFFTGSVSKVEPEINNLLTELVRADQAADAHAIINCVALNEENAKHTTNFISNFLNQLILMNAPTEDITKYASDFVELGHEPMALNNVAESSLKLGREKLSLAIFIEMHKKNIEVRPHYYWPLLVNARQNEGEAKIYSLIATMAAMNVEIDFNTLVSYVLPNVNTINPIVTLQRLSMNNIPDNVLKTSMTFFLLKKYRLEDVLHLYQHQHHKLDYRILITPLKNVFFATRDVEKCAKVLTMFDGSDYVSLFLLRLLSNNNPRVRIDEFQALLETFDNHRVKFSLYDANMLKDRLNNTYIASEMTTNLCNIIDKMTNRNLKFPVLMPIPYVMHMTTSELACCFIEKKNKGLATAKILSHLMKAYCEENNLKKAEEIKQECDRNEYPWTPSMKVHLFILYVRHNKIKEAEELLLNIETIPDASPTDQILLFATALVKLGKWKMAFSVIDNTDIKNKKGTNISCANLLTALAESKYCNHTEDMLCLLLQKNYCNINNELLKPLVSLSLRENNIPSSVEMLKKCARLYNKLPLVLEVFTTLLRAKDNSYTQNVDKYIEEVYDLMLSIKGTREANTVVLIALASLNKMEELQTMLQKQKISTATLLHYCTYMRKSNEINTILRILEASQDSDNICQILLCNVLLTFYSKTGDCKSALALWQLMCAKNIKPDETFNQSFIEFFQWNKVPLPAEFKSDINEVNVSNQ